MSSKNIGPYRIEKRLGVGGMGEVFKAYDDRLGRWVAIKRIRPDKESTDDNRERLRREARAVAQLNHSAIVQVYDIFQDGQSDCIVMEYVEGQSLDTMLANGPLEPLRAAVLGYEIAEGLSEAHTKSVIHRDLKTENIIVTPSGRAKILDFGLAKPLLSEELDPVLTGKGQLVGTSRAMSPEYVGGGEVDPRADLFSLGVLLYETVVGKSPFRAQNTLATLKQVILHRQTPAIQENPQVPAELSDLIDHLLQKEPDDRPQSAQEVAIHLGKIVGQLSSGSIDLPSSSINAQSLGVHRPHSGTISTTATIDLPPKRRPWVWIVAASLVLAAITGYLLWQRYVQTESIDFQQKDLIVVGSFENSTRESVLDTSLNTAFRVGLEQSQFAKVMPQARVLEALERMKKDANHPIDEEAGVEICKRERAKALVMGSIDKIGDSYNITGKIVNPMSGEAAYSVSKSAAGQGQILSALEDVIAEIRQRLGESLQEIKLTSQPLEKVTTPNLEALNAYSAAVAKISQFKDEEAIPLLNRAIELDRDFAMAHAKLGAVYRNLDRERAAAAQHFQLALKNSERLTDIEKNYVEGWVAFWNGDPKEMRERWSVMKELYPDEVAGYFNLGLVHMLYLNQFQEAADNFQTAAQVAEAQRLIQHAIRSYSYLVYALLGLGDYDNALRTFEKIKKLEPQWESRPSTLYLGADIQIAMERYPEALKVLEQIPTSSASSIETIETRSARGMLYADRGQFRAALPLLQAAVKQARTERKKRLELLAQLDWIAVLEYGEDRAAFVQALSSCMDMAVDLLAIDHSEQGFSPLPMLALLGKIGARNGLLEQAERIHALIQDQAKQKSFELWQGFFADVLAGEVLTARGQHAEAIAKLRDAQAAVDAFEAHESLARAFEQMGDLQAARGEYEWLLKNRGRTLAEWVEAGGRLSRMIAWTHAYARLGQLEEQQGDFTKAAEHYQKLLDRWRDGDKGALWANVAQRLAKLQSKS